MLRRPGRLAALLVLTASASLMLTATAGAAASPEQQQLVAAYAPHLMLREQTADDNCNTREEQYNPPTTVDVVLGNPAVKLVHYVGGKDVPVKRGPTAADIARLGDDYYLDLPGDPLSVKCPARGSYAKDFQALRNDGKAPAVTYAHIATEPGFTGLVVQYWFFYYFNQFNDVHEGDWEGMQISFDADTPAEALAQGPSQIALFQHAGGERADWDDAKVQKDGTHPIVYPAAGSHATFYDDAIYIQNGSHGSGVGCDDTQEPHIRSDPQPVIIPTAAAPGSEFQWLGFLGHWGQREKGFNNGPAGADHQEAVASALHLDGRNPAGQPAAAGRSGPRPGRQHGLLRGDRGHLRVHQPRGQDDHRGDRPRARPASPDRRAADVHPLAPGGHLDAAARVDRRPASPRRPTALRPVLAHDARDRPERIRDPRGHPGGAVRLHAARRQRRHPDPSVRADARVQRLVRESRRTRSAPRSSPERSSPSSTGGSRGRKRGSGRTTGRSGASSGASSAPSCSSTCSWA